MSHPEQLETRLRQALSTESERAPHPALTPEEFHHKRIRPAGAESRHSNRARWIAVAATVIVGGAVAVVAPGGLGTEPAFASWVSSPGTISAHDVTALKTACGPGTPVIVDRRGHSAYAVYRNPTSWTDCLTTVPGLTPDKGLRDTWVSATPVGDLPTENVRPSEPIVVVSVKAPEENAVQDRPVTWVSGWFDPTITRISISTYQGTVEPTLAGGAFAAWWPGNDGDTTVIRGYDRNGQLVTTIDQLTCDGPGVTPRVRTRGQAPTGGCA